MPDDDFPFVLNTGRLQHQWHTLTKTGKVAKLNKLNPGPFVEIHPDDAPPCGSATATKVEVASRRGRAVLPAVVTDRVRPGSCFAPFHWNDLFGEYLTINAVTNDAVDPVSFQPEFKACAVSMRLVSAPPEAAAPEPASPAPIESSTVSALGSAGAGPIVPGLQSVAAMLGLDALVPAVPTATEQRYLGGFLAALQAAAVTGVPVLPSTAPIGSDTRAWFDGMLAGLYSRVDAPSSSGRAATPGNDPVQHSELQTPRRSVLVLWASQTGNAESFAADTVDALTEAGLLTELVEMDECHLDRLASASEILVVTSTFGDGGPPDNAAEFWARLSADDAPSLAGARFAVLGYGDSSYNDFCGFARQVDARLAQLGATRVLERVATEPDDDESQPQWLATVAALLNDPAPRPGRGVDRAGSAGPEGAPADPPPSITPSGPVDAARVVVLTRPQGGGTTAQKAPAPAFTRGNPIPGMLVRNTVLTGPDSAKEVRQFGFDLLDAPVGYEAGDALGVYPANSPDTVQRWLAATGLNGGAMATIDGDEAELRELLRTRYDITKITPDLLKFVAARHPDEALAKLLRQDNKVELNKWMWGRHAIDLLETHAVQADLIEWQDVLKKLQPRQYSISSSPLVDPREIQLTVSVVRYDSHHGQPRGGLCSVFLADRAADGTIPIYLQSAPHFRPPADPRAPMIMIGPGTGIAPFRGFLHDRRAAGAPGRNWLFFGDQHAADNFYYRSELEDFFREGFLTRLDLAFSRDQRQRIYVQDRMLEHGAEFWRWLQDGAAVYVCGDATRMAKDVDATLLTIARTHGHLSEQEAAAFRKQLIKDGRYQRDVY